jgi:hypothetical protein
MKYDIVYVKDENGNYYALNLNEQVPVTGTVVPIKPIENVHVFTEDELKERDKEVIINFIETERKGNAKSL